MIKPELIEGGIAVDDRGELRFINSLDLNIKRFYIVSNHKSHFIRAWHGHKKEAKYVTVIQGAALIGAVEIDNWDLPSLDLKVSTFILSANKPSILYIPSGYANGFMNLTQDTKLLFLSLSTLEESKGDDFRFDSHYWDIWNIKER